MRSSQPHTAPQKGAWAIVAALFVIAIFGWGLGFYGLGFYLLELNQLRGWSIGTLSLMTFGFHAVAMVLTFPISKLLGRLGPRPIFGVGAVAMAASIAALGHVNSLGLLLVVYLVLAVGWATLSSTTISATVMLWFPERSSTALTLALTGAGFGGVLIIPLLVELNEQFGLSTTLTIVAAAEITIVGTLSLTVIRRPPEQRRLEAKETRPAWVILRLPLFWKVSIALGLALIAQVGFLVHQLNFLTTSLTSSTAAQAVSITTLAAFVGRMLFIASTRWLPPTVTGAAFLAVQASALAVVASNTESMKALFAGSAIFGLGVGVLITLPPLLTRTFFGQYPFTSAFPLVSAVTQLGVALGAPVTALLHDALGGYSGAIASLAAFQAAAVVLLVTSATGQPKLVSPMFASRYPDPATRSTVCHQRS